MGKCCATGSLRLLAFQKSLDEKPVRTSLWLAFTARLSVPSLSARGKLLSSDASFICLQTSGYQTSLTAARFFIRPDALEKWFSMIFLIGRQKAALPAVSAAVLEVRTYKQSGSRGTRSARPSRSVIPLPARSPDRMDDSYVGGPEPGKHRRGAVGKSKVRRGVETPESTTLCRRAPGAQVSRDGLRRWLRLAWQQGGGPHRSLAGLSGLELCVEFSCTHRDWFGEFSGCFPGSSTLIADVKGDSVECLMASMTAPAPLPGRFSSASIDASRKPKCIPHDHCFS